jgi:5-methylcytosine-specific restriction endonuclease McrA
VDHKHPHGQGGETSIDNLTLLCSEHNQRHADLSYGEQFMSEKRGTPAAGVISRHQMDANRIAEPPC